MALIGFLFQRRRPGLNRRCWAAVWAAPIGMILFSVLGGVFIGLPSLSTRSLVGFETVPIFVVFGTPMAWVGLLLVGFPANLVLGLLRLECGIVYGVIGAIGFPAWMSLRDPSTPTPGELMLTMLPGLLVAWTWWWLATGDFEPVRRLWGSLLSGRRKGASAR